MNSVTNSVRDFVRISIRDSVYYSVRHSVDLPNYYSFRDSVYINQEQIRDGINEEY